MAATLAIVGGLIFKLSPGELADTLRASDAWLLLAALALMCVVQALVVVKWLVLLRARDVEAPLLQVVRAYCVGNLLSNVLPTAVGGDVYRVYRIQREADARAADVTMTVLYERATGYGAMTCLGAMGAAFYYGSVAIGALAGAGGAAAALVLAVVLPRMPFPAVRHDHFLRNLLAHRRELMAVYQMAVFSLAIQALYISTIALAGRALGVHVSWWYWAFMTWVVAVAMLMPVTLGGLGVRESSFSALVKHAGATAAQGASTGFALGVLLLVANAAGLLAVEIAGRLGYGEHAADSMLASAQADPVPVER
ncbi:MAG: flippase-like domain-containing protein [Chloroflexi bacterium]|nr:flippase-like domain-containing protein [Chloroflexota bacterium]